MPFHLGHPKDGVTLFTDQSGVSQKYHFTEGGWRLRWCQFFSQESGSHGGRTIGTVTVSRQIKDPFIWDALKME
jgi:hypothetical protein